MQSLYPTSPSELTDDDLAELYAYPAERAWIRANFVSSLDGAVQGSDDKSASLSSGADRHILALLRCLADVILVGANTARVEGYQPVTEHEVSPELRSDLGLAPVPAIAVVSRSLEIDPALLAGGDAPTIVVTCASSPADRRAEIEQTAPVIVAGADEVDLRSAIEALAARGLQRVLTEGGPSLMRALVAQRALDELCLTIAPLIAAGDRLRMANGPAIDPPADWRLRHLLEADGNLFCRYTRS